MKLYTRVKVEKKGDGFIYYTPQYGTSLLFFSILFFPFGIALCLASLFSLSNKFVDWDNLDEFSTSHVVAEDAIEKYIEEQTQYVKEEINYKNINKVIEIRYYKHP